MDMSTTLSRSNDLKSYAALMSTTIVDSRQSIRENPIQLIHPSASATFVYGNAPNIPVNLTFANQFMMVYIINYERLPFRAGNTLIDGSSLFVSSDCSNIERGTDTYTSTRYDFSGLHYEPLRSSENSLLAEFFASPEIFGVSRQTMQEKQVIQKKEEQEVILADTSRPWAIEDLLFALNRISRPTSAEVEDIPLSVDPDDYPVV